MYEKLLENHSIVIIISYDSISFNFNLIYDRNFHISECFSLTLSFMYKLYFCKLFL
jgi:hypothetical protein